MSGKRGTSTKDTFCRSARIQPVLRQHPRALGGAERVAQTSADTGVGGVPVGIPRAHFTGGKAEAGGWWLAPGGTALLISGPAAKVALGALGDSFLPQLAPRSER